MVRHTEDRFPCSSDPALQPAPLQPASAPVSDLVLQPHSALAIADLDRFRATIEQALQQVTRSVMIDLLWVDDISPDLLAVLQSSVSLAVAQGKVLHVKSISATVSAQLNAASQVTRSQTLGEWSAACAAEFSTMLSHGDRWCDYIHHQEADLSSSIAHSAGDTARLMVPSHLYTASGWLAHQAS